MIIAGMIYYIFLFIIFLTEKQIFCITRMTMIPNIIAAVLPLLMLSFLVDAFIHRSNKISPFQQRVQQSSKIKMTSADIGRNLRLDVDGGVLSYDFFVPTAGSSSSSSSALGSGGTGPIGIAYLPGLVRQRNEAKSINLQTLCRRENLFFLVSCLTFFPYACVL